MESKLILLTSDLDRSQSKSEKLKSQVDEVYLITNAYDILDTVGNVHVRTCTVQYCLILTIKLYKELYNIHVLNV